MKLRVLIVNCNRPDWERAVKWFLDSAHVKEGGYCVGLSKVFTYDELTGEVSVDPSYEPSSGP